MCTHGSIYNIVCVTKRVILKVEDANVTWLYFCGYGFYFASISMKGKRICFNETYL